MQTNNTFRTLLIILLLITALVSYLVKSAGTGEQFELPSREGFKLKDVIPTRETTKPVDQNPKVVLTINGYDAATESVIPRINLWNNYDTRDRIVGQVNHGEKVTLIRRDGDGVLVENRARLRGWLTYWFIAEYQ